MEKLDSILAVIDPADESRHVVVKAMVLARHFGARLELFLCESESAFALRHAYDRTGVAEAKEICLARAQRYVDAVRRSLAEDVCITTHVACESPLYEAVVNRVRAARPDIVVKSAAGRHDPERFTMDANDWQLARTCPVPLMLTRGRPWSPAARFAAAVDVDDPAGPGMPKAVMRTAGFLALGCKGELDVLYSEKEAPGTPGAHDRREALSQLVQEFGMGRERRTILQGNADDTLPEYAARQGYDVLVLGALAHQVGISPLVGTLTSRLVDSLDCDFVLVKPEAFVTPVARSVRSAVG
jgi:universal stress protein E